ncbi:hypothetical protein [Nibribacter koreensis]|uniref:MORN repeat variant n=1 Tax=Nibribacter koreensis TaxID=1084519 RepID=A0ABP8FL71_9BACT
MKRATFLIASIVIFLSACTPKFVIAIYNQDLYGSLENGIPSNSRTGNHYFQDGTLKATGSYAVSFKNEKSELKTGLWKEYYAGGRLQREGHYKIGSYLGCGAGGLQAEYYHYKDGLWKYYDESGELRFEVEFEPTKLHFDTNCEGGDNLIYGLIKNVPLGNKEQLSPDSIFSLQKEKIEDGSFTVILTPLNNKLFITYSYN